MSEDSSPRAPVPLATWNPARGVWETTQPSLLCGHLAPYSAPWPTSGTTHAGSCYAPPTSEHPTAANGPSSPPGPPTTLLKTPTSNIGSNGGSQHPVKRKSGGHGPNLADEIEWLLPTPKASDGIKGSPNQRHGNGDLTLPSAAASLRPTPRASNTGAPGKRPGKSRMAALSAAVLPLWAEDPSEGEAKGDGDRTPPPSPDGRPSPAPHHHPPTRPDACALTSSNGCKGSPRAGSPTPQASADRPSSPHSATASSPNKPPERFSCSHRRFTGAVAAAIADSTGPGIRSSPRERNRVYRATQCLPCRLCLGAGRYRGNAVDHVERVEARRDIR